MENKENIRNKVNNENKKNKNVVLSGFQVGFMYVGAIMGAGFASGRELW